MEREPFFIVGSGRSGTTLLRAVLQAHPAVHIPPELHALGDLIALDRRRARDVWEEKLGTMLRVLRSHPCLAAFGISAGQWEALREKLAGLEEEERDLAHVIDGFYRFHAGIVKPAASRWGDKTPVNTLYMNEIRELFPRARFIHMLRDGRDVVRSLLEINPPVCGNMREAARRWVVFVRMARLFGDRHPNQYLEVRYEDLVTDPGSQIERICRFLGLELQRSMLQHHRLDAGLADVGRAQHLKGALEPIHARSVGRWREEFTPEQIAEAERLMGSLLNRLGYG
ncbi:sulfotransferase [Verrucomicrobiota bacterium]